MRVHTTEGNVARAIGCPPGPGIRKGKHTLMFELAGASGLVFELLAQLVQQLRQAAVGGWHHSTVCVVHGGQSRFGSRLQASCRYDTERLVGYHLRLQTSRGRADEVQAKGSGRPVREVSAVASPRGQSSSRVATPSTVDFCEVPRRGSKKISTDREKVWAPGTLRSALMDAADVLAQEAKAGS